MNFSTFFFVLSLNVWVVQGQEYNEYLVCVDKDRRSGKDKRLGQEKIDTCTGNLTVKLVVISKNRN